MKIIDFPQIKANQNIANAEKKSIKGKTSSKKPTHIKDYNNDTLSISNDAKELLDKEKNMFLEDIDDESDMIGEMLRKLKESKESENPYTGMIKCIQIAMRIMNGDTVPEKDKQFLIENQPEMYSNALLLRRPNNEPKRYDSLLEDKKTEPNDLASVIDFEGFTQSSTNESLSSNSENKPSKIK